MLPIYFGDPARALFGIYHPARQARAQPQCAVLCHPIGNEYVGAYRTMRVLADQLADAGVSVLRFDYFGTGDSAGSGHEASVDQWLIDIQRAIEEVKETAGAERTSLVGVRLGATLAMLATNTRSDLDNIVLWEPIVQGAAHIEQHLSRHREWLRLGRCRRENSTNNEALGYPLTDALIREISALDLVDHSNTRSERILQLFHNDKRMKKGQGIRDLGAKVEQQMISSPDFWLGRTAFDQPLVSKTVVELIVRWLTGETS